MKKVFVGLFLIVGLLLVGCDYDEKSFQALSRSDIPTKVTMDFELPRGVYAEFIWTSSNEEVLKIVETRQVQVFQQEEDVEVVLTALINKTTEDFVITVLKKGSTPTYPEQARMALEELCFPQDVVVPFPLQLATKDVVFEYTTYYSAELYQFAKKSDETLWLVPKLVTKDTSARIHVKVKIKEDGELVEIGSKLVQFTVKSDREGMLEHRRVFEALAPTFQEGDSRNRVTGNFSLPLTSSLNEEAVITWTVPQNSNITIFENGLSHVVNDTESNISVDLISSITIDEITYQFRYSVLVYPVH